MLHSSDHDKLVRSALQVLTIVRVFLWVIILAGNVLLWEIFVGPISWLHKTDTTDPPGDRSGLRLYRDHQTGIEYLGTKDGGLMRRKYIDDGE